MCGIIAYTGKENGVPIVVNGLQNLEYRGYDSCGIAMGNGDGIKVIKDTGRVNSVFEGKLDGQNSNVVMGHTRWATHGGVTQANAHPHLSNNGEIVVIHNGIVENYQDLRKSLQKNGFTFKSQTDTEVIPNLIEFYARTMDFESAVKKTMREIEGSYAVVVIRKGDSKIYAARKESPLVVGVADHGTFIASDIPAFLQHTKNVIYMDDMDFAVLGPEPKFTSLKTDLPIKHAVDSIDWSMEDAKKGKFDHFTLKEISEQAETIGKVLQYTREELEPAVEMMRNAKNIYLIANGTSNHACISASYKFASLADISIDAMLASEFSHFAKFLDKDDVVIAVSQSGETMDVMNASRFAKEKGAKLISIVNVMGSSLARMSDFNLLMRAGPEISVVSTKAYTAELTVLTLLAYALAGRFEEGKARMKDLIRHIYYLTSSNMRNYIKNLAERLRYAQHIFTMGRGLQYATALEAALKIKEVSYIHAEGFAGGELKHGTIALIEHGTPCIVFTSHDTEKEIISNAMEVKSRGAFIIGVGPNNNEVFDFYIKVREAEEANSICQIIPIQILAYQLALLRGNDPDKPRNLAKSVTVK